MFYYLLFIVINFNYLNNNNFYFILINWLSILFYSNFILILFIILCSVYIRMGWIFFFYFFIYITSYKSQEIDKLMLCLFDYFHLFLVFLMLLLFYYVYLSFFLKNLIFKLFIIIYFVISLLIWGIIWNFCFSSNFKNWIFLDNFENYNIWVLGILLLSLHYNNYKFCSLIVLILIFFWLLPFWFNFWELDYLKIHKSTDYTILQFLFFFWLLILSYSNISYYYCSVKVFQKYKCINQFSWINFILILLLCGLCDWYNFIYWFNNIIVYFYIYFLFWALLCINKTFNNFILILVLVLLNFCNVYLIILGGYLFLFSYYFINLHIIVIIWFINFLFNFLVYSSILNFQGSTFISTDWLITNLYYFI